MAKVIGFAVAMMIGLACGVAGILALLIRERLKRIAGIDDPLSLKSEK